MKVGASRLCLAESAAAPTRPHGGPFTQRPGRQLIIREAVGMQLGIRRSAPWKRMYLGIYLVYLMYRSDGRMPVASQVRCVAYVAQAPVFGSGVPMFGA